MCCAASRKSAGIAKPRFELALKMLFADVNGINLHLADFTASPPALNGNNATLQINDIRLSEDGGRALNLAAGTKLAPATLTYPVAAPILTLTSSEIPQNGTLSFTGKGFSAVEQVDVGSLGTFAADPNGGIAGDVEATAAPGQHTLTATGLTSKRTASATYTVKARTAKSPPSPRAAATASRAPTARSSPTSTRARTRTA